MHVTSVPCATKRRRHRSRCGAGGVRASRYRPVVRKRDCMPVIGKTVARALAIVLGVAVSVSAMPSTGNVCPAAKQAGASTCRCCNPIAPDHAGLLCCPSVDPRAPSDVSKPRVDRSDSVRTALAYTPEFRSAHLAVDSVAGAIVDAAQSFATSPPTRLRI